MKSRLLLFAALFAAASPVRAATVNWSTSTVAAPADVSTAGSPVGAMEVGGGTARTVNGVNFAADPGGAERSTIIKRENAIVHVRDGDGVDQRVLAFPYLLDEETGFRDEDECSDDEQHSADDRDDAQLVFHPVRV